MYIRYRSLVLLRGLMIEAKSQGAIASSKVESTPLPSCLSIYLDYSPTSILLLRLIAVLHTYISFIENSNNCLGSYSHTLTS